MSQETQNHLNRRQFQGLMASISASQTTTSYEWEIIKSAQVVFAEIAQGKFDTREKNTPSLKKTLMIRMYEFRKLNVSKDGILDDKLRSIQAQVPYKRWQQIQERNEIL